MQGVAKKNSQSRGYHSPQKSKSSPTGRKQDIPSSTEFASRTINTGRTQSAHSQKRILTPQIFVRSTRSPQPSFFYFPGKGMDSILLHARGGCFEQPPPHYPTRLCAPSYIARHRNTVTPESTPTARYIANGYQRPLTSQVTGGGLLLGRKGPSQKHLTLCLHGNYDMPRSTMCPSSSPAPGNG